MYLHLHSGHTLPKAQRDSHIPTLRRKHIQYSYMDPLDLKEDGPFMRGVDLVALNAEGKVTRFEAGSEPFHEQGLGFRV